MPGIGAGSGLPPFAGAGTGTGRARRLRCAAAARLRFLNASFGSGKPVMDFTISPDIEEFRSRIAAFVEDRILPLEADPASYDAHENIRLDLADALRSQARTEGLWCLQLKPETGGQGLGRTGMAVCYEAMNRSIFGPVVFNAAAPDDGNMMLLEAVCQSARKVDPGSASHIDPLCRAQTGSARPGEAGGGCAARSGADDWPFRL